MQPENLKTYAVELGLDAAAFDECLDGGTHAESVRADMEDGVSYGVTGTPAVFINGRVVSGAQPYEAFESVVEDELRRQGVAVPEG